MRRIGTIEVNDARAWGVRIDDRFMPAGTYDLFMGDEPHWPEAQQSDTFIEARERAAAVLREQDEAAFREKVERESSPLPPWWRKFSERWRRMTRNEREKP